jgi:lysophospholipase L1-like esterase
MKTIDPTACRYRTRAAHLLALAALLAAWLPAVQAQEEALFPTPVAAEKPAFPSPVHARWHNSLAAFAKADQTQFPASDGVVFVGSSTIRMWRGLAQDFSPLPLLNRGFGGSTLADCNALAHELVIQYKPRQVILYAGDNDLAEGRSPADVLASFASFVQRVRAELPGSRIDFISIKPSPSRLSLMPRIREANALIQAHAQTLADVRYIDVFSPMLDAQGQPRPELFLGDRLHLNAAGYQLWQSVVGAYLPAAPAAPPGLAQIANREAVSASATPTPPRTAP